VNIQHLHLHVRDRHASERFYERWLGLRIARRGHRLTFMEDDAGFSLALMDDPAPARLPDWFHFGTRLESPQAVEELHAAMNAAEVPMARPLYADETLTSFRCTDPDGYAIEIYYESA
jgi:catechol 2,3-dioxygenase-like lactoylglutathione lyase family enzyme